MTGTAERRHARLAVVAVVAGLAVPSFATIGRAAATETRTEAPTETPTPTESPNPTSTPSDSADDAFTVSDAQLRWGINDESNSRAFAPGTVNFLSAGEVPNSGSGGRTIVNGAWSHNGAKAWWAQRGNVRIEKRTPSGDYALATFKGLSTLADNTTPLGPAGSGSASDHQFVIDAGTGTVDPGEGTATIRWKGTVSVLYYSGMTYFTISDPALSITPTAATLRATLGGYASDRVDPSTWRKIEPENVVLASFPRSAVQLPGAGGFSADPAYRNVIYQPPDGSTQVRTGDDWGAFPASFLRFMEKVGSAAYWYSSGGSADAHKVPNPVTVSYSADDPVEPPAEPDEETEDPEPTQPAAPTAPPPPTQPAPPPLPDQPAAAPAPSIATPAGTTSPSFDPRLPDVPAAYALTAAPGTGAGSSSGHPWEWWLGSLLLLGAAALLLHSSRVLSGRRVKGNP